MSIRPVIAILTAGAMAATALVAVAAPAQAEEDAVICLRIADDVVFETISEMTQVPCETPHNSEIIKTLAYPEDSGLPSTIADKVLELFGDQCTRKDLALWLGTSKFKMPLTVVRSLRLPTDEEWANGARWVACTAERLRVDGTAITIEGKMRDLIAAGPLIEWLLCLESAPKSGEWTYANTCSSQSRWVAINPVDVKGKITSNYPKDLQAKANAACAKMAQGLLKPGAKAKPIAALSPASAYPQGNPSAACFIPIKSWNGKSH